MYWGKAFWVGAFGGLAAIVVTALARVAGVPVNLAMTLGTMFGLPPSAWTWFWGFIVHLVISGIIAWVYAAGFEYGTHRANAWLGAAFSVVHVIVAGLLFGLLPAIHPAIPELMAAPGIFLSNVGAGGVITFILVHLVYGLIVGALYRPVKHREVIVGGTRERPAAPAGAR
jgi:hypothetical protein